MGILSTRWIRGLDHPGLFLTYDDGPNPAVTPDLLDILRRFRGSATFFVTGEALDQPETPAILRRMVAEGHTIGNHGRLHSREAYPDFETSQRKIQAACGVRTRIFRAPHGLKQHVIEYQKRDRRAVGVHWTEHFEDWLPLDFEKITAQVPEKVQPGAILLLHDGSPSTDAYRDRSQALRLTEMIAAECWRRSIPLAGLASVYPALHRIHSGSAFARALRWAGGDAIAAMFQSLRHWRSSNLA